MEKGPVHRIRGKVEYPYEWTYGRYVNEFFRNMKQGRLTGARCTKCKKIIVPPIAVCGVCFADTEEELVPLPDTGEVISFTRVNFSYPGQIMEPPYAVGIINLDGASTRFNHLIKAKDLEGLECGSRVRARWRKEAEREGSFFDIEYFELISESPGGEGGDRS
jgi:uncharacterized OB-fold protein